MKKLLCAALCLLLVLSLALPVMAAGAKIIFTSSSSFAVGGTVTVDKSETLEHVYNNGKSEEYNAYLEGNVQYYWMRNDSYYADGPSLTIKESDKGCTFYCMAALYEDEEHTSQVSTIYSDSFTVPNSGGSSKIPEIKTKSLPNGVVGESYYYKLECSDPDATFSLLRSSLPDGLALTQHGEIEGVPQKAGMWYVVITATPEAGAEYAATAEYEFVIEEEAGEYTLEIMRLPNKLTYISGETLDLKGLWVRIWAPDGFIDSYDGKYLEYSKEPLVTVGEQKIKLTYEGAFEIFIVTVVAAPETETEPEETAPDETSAPTEGSKFPVASPEEEEETKPAKKPNKDSGSKQETKPDKTPDKEQEPAPDAQESGGIEATTVIIIVLSVLCAAAIAAVVVLLIKRKK